MISLVVVAALAATAAAEADRRLLKGSSVCMDGSPAGYYFQAAQSNAAAKKFIIHLQGGGECTTKDRCLAQKQSALGSSNGWPESQFLGFLNTDQPDQNPTFWDWNHVQAEYCSQDLWTGTRTSVPRDNSTWGLYFSGALNLRAILDDLDKSQGLFEATDIILSGDSAGGIGVWPNLDALAQRYPSARVVGAPIAGFYFDADQPYDGPGHTSSGLANFSTGAWPQHYALWQSAVNPGCAAAFPNNPGQCILANNSWPYVKTPVFVTESQTDKVVLLDHDWVPSDLQPKEQVDEYLAVWSRNMTTALTAMHGAKKQNGVFSAACFIHTGFSATSPIVNGLNYFEAFGQWFNETAGASTFHMDDCGILCNPTCPHGP